MRSTTLLFLATLLAAPGAQALEKCKVKAAKDGTLRVSAADVDGPLLWSWWESGLLQDLANADDCIDAGRGKAKGCILAEEGESARSMPPPLCRVYLEDDSSSCEARLKKCVPGMRPGCPPDTEPVGGLCIDKVARGRTAPLTRDAALAACHAAGRSLCATPVIMTCDSLNLSSGTNGSCGWYTDSGGVIWTEGTHEKTTGSSVFGDLNCYNSNGNEFVDSCQTTGSLYPYFCCTSPGGL